jgi:tRNA (uracil-5-)-methyltransferase
VIPAECTPEACQRQLATKIERLDALFAGIETPPLEIHASPDRHFRKRVEFRVWHEGDQSCFLMFGADREPLRIERFEPASARINELMQGLRTELAASPTLRSRLFQVEFLDSTAGESLLTLIYHRPLDEQWIHAARAAQARLGARLVGRSRGQRVPLDDPWITERFSVDDTVLVYRQPEGCFTQPNAAVNRAMLGWARDACRQCHDDLLELYCGIGNFTVALAPLFRSVLATEIDTTAIAAARHNLETNGIANCTVARLSSAEAAAALGRERPFRRLAGFDLDRFAPDTLLVDPPRAGLDARTLAFASDFRRIVYISCNPLSLHANLLGLGPGFRIERFAAFDQFPYTHHLECGVVLERR